MNEQSIECWRMLFTGMFARQNAQSSNPKVRMLAAEKRFTSAEVALQRAEKDLERAVEIAKKVKPEPSAGVSPPFAIPQVVASHGGVQLRQVDSIIMHHAANLQTMVHES